MNNLVTDLLSKGLPAGDERALLKARLKAAGRLVIPPQPKHASSRDEAIEGTRGLGRAASEAIERDRSRW